MCANECCQRLNIIVNVESMCEIDCIKIVETGLVLDAPRHNGNESGSPCKF